MTSRSNRFQRRAFLQGMAGAVAAAGAVPGRAADASASPLTVSGPTTSPPSSGSQERAWMAPTVRGLYRVEMNVADCEVEGKIPTDLAGAFYRVGPDPQYPMRKGNIPFDGEGHVSMFRFKDGHVAYRSRYIRNERYVAQEKAGRILFPMYRNPYLDDPSVKGLSRSTANTHIIHHRDMLLALKEDSPPTALDLNTLETKVANYTFDGTLPSRTFTAHPKLDSRTGNMLGFGYEADGHGSDALAVFEYSPQGKLVWNAKVRMPYVCALHDFSVTDNFIAFFLMPLAFDAEQMARGGIHWSWDSSLPSYFGYMRRGGDGSDIRWIKGPTRGNFHVMGCFDDGKKLYADLTLSQSNPLNFMPQKDGAPFNQLQALSHLNRLTIDTTQRNPRSYGMDQMYPHSGGLPRQDDRYNTVAYRYGFLPCPDPSSGDPLSRNNCYARFDHQTRETRLYKGSAGTDLAECCFAPRAANAPEGSGYLMGVATRHDQGGATQLVILDAERPDAGPVATVHLPVPIVGQVHGWWVPQSQLPAV
jgi:carotenoid cleavage dioxygenase-like enzyme